MRIGRSVFSIPLMLAISALAQQPTTAPAAASSVATTAVATTPAPAATFKAASRMVTVEVVARDHHGMPISGLTKDDFQVFEQIGGKRAQHPQKIAAFRAVTVAEIAAQDRGKFSLPAGVYTNLVTMDKVPVPPTVLLVDGINTDRASQMQVHRQMIKMLGSIPDDVPVAVFLMGQRLIMVQNFTTDPKL